MDLPLALRIAPFSDAAGKRRAVTAIIEDYARNHQAADVGITLATSWLPAGGLIATAGTLAIQAPLVYQPMVREIGRTYLAGAPDDEVRALVHDTAIEGAKWDLGVLFGVEFFEEILTELLREMGAGALLGIIPFIGSIAAAVLDAKVAATLTWRVGLMAAIYYENGCAWLVDRKTTYERAHLLIHGLSAKTEGRFDMSGVADTVDGVREQQRTLLRRYVETIKDAVGYDHLREVLDMQYQIEPALIDAVLGEIRRRRIGDVRPSADAHENGAANGEAMPVLSDEAYERFRIVLRVYRNLHLDDAAIVERCIADLDISREAALEALRRERSRTLPGG